MAGLVAFSGVVITLVALTLLGSRLVRGPIRPVVHGGSIVGHRLVGVRDEGIFVSLVVDLAGVGEVHVNGALTGDWDSPDEFASEFEAKFPVGEAVSAWRWSHQSNYAWTLEDQWNPVPKDQSRWERAAAPAVWLAVGAGLLYASQVL